jgi:TonB family protein
MFGAARTAPLTRFGPRPVPIAFSLVFHAGVLSLVAFGPVPPRSLRARSLYDEVIKPHQHDLVWYSFPQKLPEVSPAENPSQPDSEQLLSKQTIVSKPKIADRGSQMVWRPVPQLKPQQEMESPNILAFRMPLIAPPPPLKALVPPSPKSPNPAVATPNLPEPPKVEARIDLKSNPALAADLAAPLENRPKARTFVPPAPPPVRTATAPCLPEAPELATTLRSDRIPLLPENMAAPLANKPQQRTFVPPAARARPSAAPGALPEAPNILAQVASAGLGQNPAVQNNYASALANKPKPRAFVPPPSAAPGGNGSNVKAGVPLIQEAPSLDAAGMPSSRVDVAVVGLNPATKLAAPLPDSSRPAKFSVGPNANGGNGSTAGSSSALSVPGLLVRGSGAAPANSASSNSTNADALLVARAAPTSRATLEAAAKAAAASPTSIAAAPLAPAETEIHLAPPPDPSFNGRDVYTLAVQMPNITSYVGSWIMWFSERGVAGSHHGRDIRPPAPVHKVDPRYLPAAIAERIEGKVQLAGVIHTDGRVGEIRILKGIDPRLDLSAGQALMKWEFTPAERDGVPIEVDVVAEIPFILPPLVRR